MIPASSFCVRKRVPMLLRSRIQNLLDPARQLRLVLVGPGSRRGWAAFYSNDPRVASYEEVVLPYSQITSLDRRADTLHRVDECLNRHQVLLSTNEEVSANLLNDARNVLEQAHQLLEEVEPGLARRRLFLRHEMSPPSSLLLSSTATTDVSIDWPLSQRCDRLLSSWAALVRKAHDSRLLMLPGIPQRSQFFLEQMDALPHVHLSVESYNKVMEAWAWSNEHLQGLHAERVFTKLIQGPVRPNGESYRLIIWAWSLSRRDRKAAFTATGHLMKMLRKLERGDEDMEPSLEDYHVVLNAWTQAEDTMSPGKAHSVLKLMDYAHNLGTTLVRPDIACYRYVLQTAASRPNVPDLGRTVDGILAQMRDRLVSPDSTSYTSAIRTWKHSALNPEMAEFRERSVRRTLELLSEMEIAHKQSSVDIKISTENVNDVIESLSVSSNRRRMEQAELLLERMETALQEKSLGYPLSNASSYKHTLNVWRMSGSIEKVPRAVAILWRMKENFSALQHSIDVVEFVAVFNAFVQVCASARPLNEEMGMDIFRDALAGVHGMKDHGLVPNAESYAALLDACGLLSVGKDRQRVVDEVFKLACEAGMVDDAVLSHLRAVATDDQYSRIVIAASELVEGIKMVPYSWTKNALGGRVLSADGRRTRPLSVDGQLTVTLAMREFQMRRLRDKRNRNLLQGGRLRNLIK